jgi:hypothetical protein
MIDFNRGSTIFYNSVRKSRKINLQELVINNLINKITLNEKALKIILNCK